MAKRLTTAEPEIPLVPGFEDGLGRRDFVGEGDDAQERLQLCPALAGLESAVRDRVGRLGNFRHVRFTRLRGVEREGTGTNAKVFVLADPVPGVRLSDVLSLSGRREIIVDINAALQVVREILPALSVLHDSRAVTHGAIAPERLILSSQGRVLIADHGLGLALEKLKYPRSRLYREFRVAMPPVAGLPKFDQRADVAQVALVLLELVLGGRLSQKEFPDALKTLLQNGSERLSSGGTRPISQGLRTWFERALPMESRRPFATALEAQVALEDVVKTERLYAPAPSALKAFLGRVVEAQKKNEPAPMPVKTAPAEDAAPVLVAPADTRPADSGRAARRIPPAPPIDDEADEIRQLELEIARLTKLEDDARLAAATLAAEAAAEPAPPAPTPDVVFTEPGQETSTPVAPVVEDVDAIVAAMRAEEPLPEDECSPGPEPVVELSAYDTVTPIDLVSAADAAAQAGGFAPPVAAEPVALEPVVPSEPTPLVWELDALPVSVEGIEIRDLPVAGAGRQKDPQPFLNLTVIANRSHASAIEPAEEPGEEDDVPTFVLAPVPAFESTTVTSSPSVLDEPEAGVQAARSAAEPPEPVETAPATPAEPLWTLTPPEPDPALTSGAEPADEPPAVLDPGPRLPLESATAEAEAGDALVRRLAAMERRASVSRRQRRTLAGRVERAIQAAPHGRPGVERLVAAGFARPKRPQRRPGLPAPASMTQVLPADASAVRCAMAQPAVSALDRIIASGVPLALRADLAAPHTDWRPAPAPALLAAESTVAVAASLAVIDLPAVVALQLLRQEPLAPAVADETPLQETAVVGDTGGEESALELSDNADLGAANELEPDIVDAGQASLPDVVGESGDVATAGASEPATEPDTETLPEPVVPATFTADPVSDATTMAPRQHREESEPQGLVSEPLAAFLGFWKSWRPGSDLHVPTPSDLMDGVVPVETTRERPEVEAAPARVVEDAVPEPLHDESAIEVADAADSESIVDEPLGMTEPLAVAEAETGEGGEKRVDVAAAPLLVEAPETPAVDVDPVLMWTGEVEAEVVPPLELSSEALNAALAEMSAGLPVADVTAAEPPAGLLESPSNDLPADDAGSAAALLDLDLAQVPDGGPSVPAADVVVSGRGANVEEPDARALSNETEPEALPAAVVETPMNALAAADLAAIAAPVDRGTSVDAEVASTPPAENNAASASPVAAAEAEPEREPARADVEPRRAPEQERVQPRRKRGRGGKRNKRQALPVVAPTIAAAPVVSMPVVAVPVVAPVLAIPIVAAQTAAPVALPAVVVPEPVEPVAVTAAQVAEAPVPEATAPVETAPPEPVVTPQPFAPRDDDRASKPAPVRMQVVPAPGQAEAPSLVDRMPAWRRRPEAPSQAPVVEDAAAVPPPAPFMAAEFTPSNESSSVYTGLGVAPSSFDGPESPVEARPAEIAPEAPAVAAKWAPRGVLGLEPEREPSTGTADESSASLESETETRSAGHLLRFPAKIAGVKVDWKRTAAACLVVTLLEGVAFAAAFWFVKPSQTGSLLVQTNAQNVEVFLDGRPGGLAPISVDKLKPGRYTVEMRNGTARKVFAVEISAGVQTTQFVRWAASARTGNARITSNVRGARVMVDGESRGTTPAMLDALAPGPHQVVVDSDKGSVKKTISIVADETTEIDLPIYSGWLTVFAAVEVRVFEDSHLLGTSNDGRMMLSAGAHRVELVSQALGIRETRDIVIEPGRVTPLSVDAPSGTVEVSAPDGTEVIVDGQPSGVTPIAPIAMTAGTHVILLRHPQQGERHQTVTVGVSAPVRVTFTP